MSDSAFNDFPELLMEARHRPGLYFPAKSIIALLTFVRRIDFAEAFHQIPPPARFGGFDFAAFEEWVNSNFNVNRLSCNSFTLAEKLAGSDEGGLALWYSWYDDFRQNQLEAASDHS